MFDSASLKHKENKTYKIRFASKYEYDSFIKKKSQKWKIVDKTNKEHQVIVVINEKDSLSLIKEIAKFKVKDLGEIKETLEDYFMSFYKEDRSYVGLN